MPSAAAVLQGDAIPFSRGKDIVDAAARLRCEDAHAGGDCIDGGSGRIRRRCRAIGRKGVIVVNQPAGGIFQAIARRPAYFAGGAVGSGTVIVSASRRGGKGIIFCQNPARTRTVKMQRDRFVGGFAAGGKVGNGELLGTGIGTQRDPLLEGDVAFRSGDGDVGGVVSQRPVQLVIECVSAILDSPVADI